MDMIFSREEMLLGADKLNILQNSHVAVFGVGGVGGYSVESLVRSGIGEITVVDNDTVALSNINRQIIALHSTVGQPKVQAIKTRALDINPEVVVHDMQCFFRKENVENFDFAKYDYVIDAIDTVSSKLLLAEICFNSDINIISCMGAGNKLDPTAFQVTDVFKTSVCPLARVMRSELRKRNVEGLKVVYSTEPPLTPLDCSEVSNRRQTPGSVAFVPSVAGLIAAGEVVKDLTK